jgi:hypothetical protein
VGWIGGERRPAGWSAAQPGGSAACAHRGGLPTAPAESRAGAARSSPRHGPHGEGLGAYGLGTASQAEHAAT